MIDSIRTGRHLIYRVMAGVVLILVIALAGKYLYSVSSYQKAVKEIKVGTIDLGEIPDGVYTGKYNVEYIGAKVKVTVKSGAITDIMLLEHRNERGGAAESIPASIVEQQKVDVDAVSGATNSSKVIEKAVEAALKQAK